MWWRIEKHFDVVDVLRVRFSELGDGEVIEIRLKDQYFPCRRSSSSEMTANRGNYTRRAFVPHPRKGV
jgi:hypothetical protein